MAGSTKSSRKLYWRLLQQVKPYWKTFAVGIFFMVILAMTEAGIPALLKPVLDGTFVDQDPVYLAWAPLGIIALFLVRGIAALVNRIAFSDVSTRVVYDLRERMFHRLLMMPTHYYDAHATGNIISKVTYDVNQVTEAAIQVLTVAVKDTLAVAALVAYIFWLDWQLALFVFLLVPVVAAVAIVVGKRLRRISRQLQTAIGDLTHILEEALRGHKAVKIFGGQPYEQSRFNKLANWVRRLQMKYLVAGSISVPTVELIGAIIMALVIYIGTARAEADQLSVGGFVAFFTALGLLFSPIKRLTKINEPLQKGLAAAESVFGLLAQDIEMDRGEARWPEPKGRIHCTDLDFYYPGAKQCALNQVNLLIEAGETVALVGSSGSGKSTLASLIPRLYTPTSGMITLDGIDTALMSLRELRSHIALVSQETVLFNEDIATNIAYGLTPRPAEQAIIQAAKAAYADEFIQQLPEGYHTLIGENGIRLSGGQRQRIAVARALLKDAQILILDEATSALDNDSEHAIQQALEMLRGTRTLLIIAHRLSTVENADRILVMERGAIVEEGAHAQLLEKNGRYAALYRQKLS